MYLAQVATAPARHALRSHPGRQLSTPRKTHCTDRVVEVDGPQKNSELMDIRVQQPSANVVAEPARPLPWRRRRLPWQRRRNGSAGKGLWKEGQSGALQLRRHGECAGGLDDLSAGMFAPTVPPCSSSCCAYSQQALLLGGTSSAVTLCVSGKRPYQCRSANPWISCSFKGHCQPKASPNPKWQGSACLPATHSGAGSCCLCPCPGVLSKVILSRLPCPCRTPPKSKSVRLRGRHRVVNRHACRGVPHRLESPSREQSPPALLSSPPADIAHWSTWCHCMRRSPACSGFMPDV